MPEELLIIEKQEKVCTITLNRPERRNALSPLMLLQLVETLVRLKSDDPVGAALAFARSHGVSDIIVGRSRQPLWRRLLGRSPMHRIIEEAEGFDVHIVALDAEAGANP